MPKYEIIEQDRLYDRGQYRGHRIRALRDIPEHGVKAGALGGYIDSEKNLSHNGAAWVADRAAALDGSRVEGDAIAKNNARLRDNAVLGGKAVLQQDAVASDFAIIRGSATVSIGGGSSIEGNVIIEGDTPIMLTQTHRIDGDREIRDQSELPWALNQASLNDPDFLPRMQEAVQIDPAFHRLMAAFGAHSPDERQQVVEQMFNGNQKSRESLQTFARHLGGTFQPDTYKAISDLQAMQYSAVGRHHIQTPNYTNYRTLHWVLDEKLDTSDREPLHAAVVRAVVKDAQTGQNKEYFQPALAQSIAPEMPALTPMQMQLFVAEGVYNDFSGATRAAEKLVASLRDNSRVLNYLLGEKDARPSSLVDVDVSHLPLVTHIHQSLPDYNSANYSSALDTMRITMQKLGKSDVPEARKNGLLSSNGNAVIEIKIWDVEGVYDFSKIAQGANFHSSLTDAHKASENIFASVKDVLKRVEAEITDTARLLSEAESSLATADNPAKMQRLRATINRLDPPNVSVISMVDRVETPVVVEKELETGITLDQIRNSIAPLEWVNAPDPWNPKVTTESIHLATTISMNAKYTVERESEQSWNLYVESPGAQPNDEPLHREDGFPDADAAYEAAEIYRVKAVAAVLGIDAGPRQELSAQASSAQPMHELAVALRTRTTDGVAFFPGSLTLKDDGRIGAMSFPDQHSTAEAALSSAKVYIQQQAQNAHGPVIDMPVKFQPAGMTP